MHYILRSNSYLSTYKGSTLSENNHANTMNKEIDTLPIRRLERKKQSQTIPRPATP